MSAQSRPAPTRLPPGQYETEKWPVLHSGSVPRFDPARWDFKVWGEVETPVRLTYQEFMALPKTTMTRDIHCVTAWSKFDVAFEGVPAKDQPDEGRIYFLRRIPRDPFNLTDEEYILSLNNNGNRYNPGTPRALLLTVNVTF